MADIQGTSSGDTLTGGIAADTVRGFDGNDSLIGGGGADTIFGGTGNDTIDGGAANDTITGGSGNDSILGGLGDDTIAGGIAGVIGAPQTGTGTAANPYVLATFANTGLGYGTATGSTFNFSSAGNLFSVSATDNDAILNDWTAGNYYGTATPAQNGGDPTSLVSASTVPGVAVGEQLTSGRWFTLRYTDPVSGELTTVETFLLWDDSNNTSTPSGGGTTYVFATKPLINGVTYTVIAINENAGVPWSALTPSTTGLAEAGGNDTIDGGDGADSILGGDGADSLLGGAGVFTDILRGGDGDDTLRGDAGNDSLFGDAGNDSIFGDAGADTIEGGADNDTIDGGTEADSILGGTGADSLLGGIGTFDDILRGEAGNDTLSGADGNDILDGGADADSLLGGVGIDTLTGGTGADRLDGGAGIDAIDGGADRDTIIGGNTGETVFGGETGDDVDTLDLTGFGRNKIYFDANPENGRVEFRDINGNPLGPDMYFFGIEDIIPCFTPGTLIATPRGERAVETLAIGDLVLTMDDGPQPLRWVGNRSLDDRVLARAPNLAPVLVAKGSLGAGMPEADLWLSPQHRVLLQGYTTQLIAGHERAFAPAKMLANASPSPLGVTYLHLMFDRHQIVFANGAPCESLLPSARAVSGFEAQARHELMSIFPQLRVAPRAGIFALAAPVLTGTEVRCLKMVA